MPRTCLPVAGGCSGGRRGRPASAAACCLCCHAQFSCCNLPTSICSPAHSASTRISFLLQEAQATLMAKEDNLQQMRGDMADLRRQLQAAQHPLAAQHQRQQQQQPTPGLQTSASPELHREAGPAAAEQCRPVHAEVGWVHMTSWWPLQDAACKLQRSWRSRPLSLKAGLGAPCSSGKENSLGGGVCAGMLSRHVTTPHALQPQQQQWCLPAAVLPTLSSI